MATVFQVIAEAHEASGVPASEIAPAKRIIPPGACVATDQASYTIAINRFVSTVPGCSLMIDGVGTDYALSNGRNGQTGAGFATGRGAAVDGEVPGSPYAWLTTQNRRIPWTPQLTAYFQSHFVPLTEGPDWLYIRTAHPKQSPDQRRARAVQPRANERSTRPVRGLGANEVDLRGTRSPCAATSRTSSADSGGQMTAVPPAAAPPNAQRLIRVVVDLHVLVVVPTCHSRPSSSSCIPAAESARHRAPAPASRLRSPRVGVGEQVVLPPPATRNAVAARCRAQRVQRLASAASPRAAPAP